jgi:prepilin-type N-terminal cleavage/methylation domain-containing protein
MQSNTHINMKVKIKFIQGFSLIEMLVVILVFSTVSVITTQAVASSLRNTRKSDSISKTRENVDFSISTMERLLRNAQNITSLCDGTATTTLTYNDERNIPGIFSCVTDAGVGHIASGSGATPPRLTGTDVNIDCTQTSFVCTPAVPPGVPQSVRITVSGSATNATGAEAATVTSSTKILLRIY